MEYDNLEYVMTTSITSSVGQVNDHLEEIKAFGLRPNLVYTFLGCAEIVDSYGKEAKIVCIRNPCGDFEWNQDWSA